MGKLVRASARGLIKGTLRKGVLAVTDVSHLDAWVMLLYENRSLSIAAEREIVFESI
jgi:hypothetical protein